MLIQFPTKIAVTLLIELGKNSNKIHIEAQKNLNCPVANIKNRSIDNTIVIFKIYYTALVTKHTCYCHKNRHQRLMEQNRKLRNESTAFFKEV